MTIVIESFRWLAYCGALGGLLLFNSLHAGEPRKVNLWPAAVPGETKALPPEADQTKASDRLIAGRKIIKLGNVSTPQIEIFPPPAGTSTGTTVLICPGGGHNILAYDLEGTEVAQWLNSIGVTGVVLKYRVPARDPQRRWSAAVQDAQRAMSLLRARAGELQIDVRRIGICGFSAGGETAGLTCLLDQRQYAAIDEVDQHPYRPDFAMLIYPAGFVVDDNSKLRDYVNVTRQTPPTFFVHAFDDRVSPLNSLLLAAEFKRAGVSAEVHVFATGGHGYGLRKTEQAVTGWTEQAAQWLKASGYLTNPSTTAR